jgi:glycine hydroxymethyltransferase
VQFGIGKDGLLDYNEIWKLAKKEKPKLMLIGTTSYPLAFNWKKFAEIADSIDAWLVADISHVIGLIVAGVYPSPVNYVHAITSTTHKTLRGPRGAIIWATKKGVKKDAELPSRISKAVFPGLQGGPHNNTTAGIAVALELALKPEFKKYGQQVTKNAKVLANELKKGGLTLYANGTQCHLVVVDLIPMGLSGNVVAEALEEAGIVINRNSVPDDPMPPFYPSGIRLGSPALTARGMKEKEMVKVSEWILKVIDHVKIEKLPTDPAKLSEFLKAYRLRIAKDKFLKEIASEVKSLCNKFPTP